MNYKTTKFKILASFLIFCLFNSCKTDQKDKIKESTKLNVLFIAVDDLRPELNCYGKSFIQSPSIDKLASESMVFNRAYCNVPVCGASRASILSGMRPARHRFLDWKTYQQQDMPGVLSIPMHFKNNGYKTISNGKIYHHLDDDSTAWHEIWHPVIPEGVSWRDYQTQENLKIDLGPHDGGKAFEKVDGHDTIYFDGKTTAKSVRDLKQLKQEGEPFFLAVGFRKPHLPFNAPAKYWDLYDRESFGLPDSYIQPETTPSEAFHPFGELRDYAAIPKDRFLNVEEAKDLIHGYNACVSYIDAQIGELLKTLDELELAENTIIVLWGDHGWNLGDHKMWTKHCNFETALRVPLIVKAPGKTSGQKSDAIVELIDVFPGLSELAGLEIPENVDGKSFVPIIENKHAEKDFAISKFHDGITLIKDKYFYTEWLNDEGVVRAKMLFDHKTDPLEINNLIDHPDYQTKAQELSKILHENWGDSFFD